MKTEIVHVVDDDPSVRASIAMFLRALQLDCRTYEDGKALLAAIGVAPPGCILTDLRMPEMSGIELQAQLTKLGCNWPLIVMTGAGEVPDAVKAMKNGAIEFIQKPFTDDVLLGALHAGFVTLRERLVEDLNSHAAPVREALQAGEVHPRYQAKADLASRQTVGFEALLRWGDYSASSGGGQIHQAFNDRALARSLSEQMLEMIFSHLKGWRQAALPFGHVAINASSTDLLDPDYSANIAAQLTLASIPPSSIQIEVTESILIGTDVDQVTRTLHGLRELGVAIALDDFGTGFASLAHLQDIPFDIIKIDKGFVQRLPEPAAASVVRALIGLAKNLGKITVAEGVETEDQAAFLTAQGCDHAQGYLFGEAQTAEAVAAMLTRSGAATV